MSNVGQFFEETANMNSDVLAMDILTGIFDEAVSYVDKDGDLIKEFIARTAALLSSFIETVQISRKEGDFKDLVAFLGAIRFRYCGISKKKGI